MGELKFNHELSVFEEKEDPLQNSLHLEDLLTLTSSLHVEERSPIANLTMENNGNNVNAKFSGENPVDETDQTSNSSTSSLHVLPRPPSLADVALENAVSSITSADNVSDDMTSTSREQNYNEERTPASPRRSQQDQNFSFFEERIRASSSSQLRQKLSKMSTSKQHLNHIQSHATYKGSWAYTIPHVKSSNSEETIMTTASGQRYQVTKGLKSIQTRDDCSGDLSSATSSFSQLYHAANSTRLDDASFVSRSSTLSSRITKILKPRWLKRRQEKKRMKKDALSNVRNMNLIQDQHAQHAQHAQHDDESIATAISMQSRSEARLGAPVIENMESLDYLSRRSFSRPLSPQTNSTSSRKYIRTSTININGESVKPASFKETLHADPIMKKTSAKTSKNTRRKGHKNLKSNTSSRFHSDSLREKRNSEATQSNSSSPTSHSNSRSCNKQNERTIEIAKPYTLHRAKSDSLSIVNKPSRVYRSKSDSPSDIKTLQNETHRPRPLSPSKFSTSEKTKKSHKRGSSYVSHLLDTPSSIGSSSYHSPTHSAFLKNQPRKTKEIAKPYTLHRAKSDSLSIANKPDRMIRSKSDSPSDFKTLKNETHRPRPLSPSKILTPEKTKNSHKRGNSYVSHLLDTPSSIGSSSYHSFSPYQAQSPHQSPSLSAFLEGPSSCHNSDSGSVASGVSLAESCSSVYTALSNLSYKDPCAKPSKIVKRSNLKLSDKGDGDIWVEKIFISKRTKTRRTFFVSVATGRRCRDEPPTGASKIVYQDDLRELRRIEREEQQAEHELPTHQIPQSIGGLSYI